MLSTPTGDIPFAEAVQMHAAADSVMMALFISVSDWDGCEVIRRFQSEKVYEVDCSLSHAEIIVGLVLLDLLSASGATEAVETGVGPTYSDLPLYVPVLGYCPCISVGDTETSEPSLVAGILKFLEVCSQERERDVDTADVILSAEQVRTDEVSGESVAEPVSDFRLHDPMLPLAVV